MYYYRRFILFSFFQMQLLFHSTESAYKCSCEASVLITCRTNATQIDLCHQCQLTKCGADVSNVYFHYYDDAPCLAKDLSKCCPKVTTVVVDDKRLCDCYCNNTNLIVQSFSQTTPFDCPCSHRNHTTISPVTHSPAPAPFFHGGSFGIGISVGIFAVILLIIVALLVRKFRPNIPWGPLREDQSTIDD